MNFGSSLMTPVEVGITFNNNEDGTPRKTAPNPKAGTAGAPEEICVYERKEAVCGEVTITPKKGKKFDHAGISVSINGVLEAASGVLASQRLLCSEIKEVAGPGTITEEKVVFPFDFTGVEKTYDSYYGANMNVRYFIRVIIKRKLMPTTNRDADFLVVDYGKAAFGLPVLKKKSISMDVGIKDCLAIRLDIEHSVFHLNEVILGTILFDLVRIRMKRMELTIIKREYFGRGTI